MHTSGQVELNDLIESLNQLQRQQPQLNVDRKKKGIHEKGFDDGHAAQAVISFEQFSPDCTSADSRKA